MSRAGRRAMAKAKAEHRAFLWDNKWRVALIVVLAAALTFSLSKAWAQVFGNAFPEFPVEPFAAGFSVASFFWLVAWVLREVDDTKAIRRGAEAEVWTSEALRKLRQHGWHIIDNLEFDFFDVDHVAIGPAGVLAVETKWTAFPWRVTSSGLAGPYGDPVRQASRNARTIEGVLASRGVHVKVWPTLVLWGRKTPSLTDGGQWVDSAHGRVLVLIGQQSGEWRKRLAAKTTLNSADSAAVVDVLEDLRGQQRRAARRST